MEKILLPQIEIFLSSKLRDKNCMIWRNWVIEKKKLVISKLYVHLLTVHSHVLCVIRFLLIVQLYIADDRIDKMQIHKHFQQLERWQTSTLYLLCISLFKHFCNHVYFWKKQVHKFAGRFSILLFHTSGNLNKWIIHYSFAFSRRGNLESFVAMRLTSQLGEWWKKLGRIFHLIAR